MEWHWSEDALEPLAFCVRTLVLDGLAVPPFDRHGDGDHRLRDLGLDEGAWRGWVQTLLEQHGIMAELARTMGPTAPPASLLGRARDAGERLRRPGSCCPGSPALRTRLDDLYLEYEPYGDAWRRRISDPRSRMGSGRLQRSLWKDLTPFHDRIPTLSVFLVEYDEAVVMPLPPTTCLIAPDADAELYAAQVVSAAWLLAAASR